MTGAGSPEPAKRARGLLTRARQPAGGFTLVEVLIAVILLTIGIFAALRIFPGGLDAIQMNRNRMLAARLAQEEVSRWKLRSDSVPDAIVASTSRWVSSMYVLEFPVDYDPRDLRADQRQPLWLPISASLPRTILGESARIGQAPWRFEAANQDLAVLPIVSLGFSPIVHLHEGAPGADLANSAYADPLIVYSERYQRTLDVQVLARPPVSMDSGRYYVDYENATLSFDHMQDRSRTFRVQYSWYESDPANPTGPVRMRQWLENIEVPAGADTAASPITLAAASRTGFQGVLWGSESVHLAFRRVPGPNNIQWPDQFWIGAVDGQVREDPLAGGRSDLVLAFLASNAGKKIKVDYRVRDWTILREEFNIPSSRRVKLAITHDKDLAYTNPPRQRNALRIDEDVSAAVMALDMETGERFLGGNWAERDPEAAPPGLFRVDFTNGLAFFPPKSVGRSYRILYRAEDDWTVQVMKPAREYEQFGRSLSDPAGSAVPGYNTFVWDAAASDADKRREVVFALADLDKSVSFDYWADVDGSRQHVTDEVHRIERASRETAVGEPYTDVNGNGVRDPGEPYTDANGNGQWDAWAVLYLDNPPVQNGSLSASGVGLRARVLWLARIGSRSIQGSGLGEKWMEASVDSFVAGSSGP
jgi:type II secretory pathway pseudopilin PulG